MLKSISFICILFLHTYINAQCTEWEGKSIDFSHGKLEVSNNKRYLQHADKTPFLYMGDTAWELIHRLNEEEVSTYLENRRKKGFNVIQTVILAELDGLTVANRLGDKPLINNNPLTPNIKYFEWVDKVINLAYEKGLYIGLLPTWGDKVDNSEWGIGPVIFNEKNAFHYGQWLGERYKDFPNIIWINGGDRLGGGKNFKIWDAIAKGIKSKDRNHLMSFHPMGGHSSSEWFHTKEWLDFNMAQTGHCTTDYYPYESIISKDYNLLPTKPCMDAEPRYENHPICWMPDSLGWFNAYDTRKAMYWSIFSGALGHTYGCHDVWQMKTEKHKPIGFSRGNWKSSLELEGANNIIHARRLLESFSWNNRQPFNQVITSRNDNLEKKIAAIKGDNYVLIYTPEYQVFTCNLTLIWNKQTILKAQWFNPCNGDYSKEFTLISDKNVFITPPETKNYKDFILIIKNKDI